MEKNVSLKPADKRGLLSAAALDKELFPDSPWGEPGFERCLLCGPECCLTAEEKDTGRLLGYVIFSAISDSEIYRIGVDPNCRRQGIGTLLLDTAEAFCREQGGERLFLEVREDNVPALSLYTSAGFKEIYRRKAYYKDPVTDAVIMEKLIVKEKETGDA